MRAYLRSSLAATAALSLMTLVAACGDDDGPPINDDPDARVENQVDAPIVPGIDAGDPPAETIRLSEDISEDTTLLARNEYIIPRLKPLFVTNGATLTIEPGTTVKGEQGSVLVVARGSKIIAEGTAELPITFTSSQPDNAKTRGFWGGVLILGAASINNNVNSDPASNEATFEAFTSAIPEGKFGGDVDDDNSGVLKYVRIQFAGYNFVSDREFNDLTLCGVGSGTVVDYVQIHGGSDDGIELFGGTVNVKHIVSSQNQDDGFDTDNGWQGKAQFVIVQNVKPEGSREASNGYESDNHSTSASYAAEPRTLPTVYNVTVYGARDYAGGKHFASILRRGTGGHYFNHIIANFPTNIEVRDLATKTQLDEGDLFIKSSIIFNGAAGNTWPAPEAANDIDEATYFENDEWDNQFVAPLLSDPSNLTAPNFKPAAGSPALAGFAPVPAGDDFFEEVDFIGAMGAEDWTAGWTAYPQPTN